MMYYLTFLWTSVYYKQQGSQKKSNFSIESNLDIVYEKIITKPYKKRAKMLMTS